jgi:hypothetical protein
MKLQLNEQVIDEKSNSMAHSQKIMDTQTELEKKISDLMKEEELAKKDNEQLKE